MALLTVQQAAEHYGVTEQTVRRWCRDGLLDAEQIGRGWRIHEKERPAEVLADRAGQDEVLISTTLKGEFTWNT